MTTDACPEDPDALIAQAEEAERQAARCYNVVDYAEYIETARRLRERAREVAASS